MIPRIIQKLQQHEHWFAEGWSSLLLIITGFYGLCLPASDLLHRSFTHGFLKILPDGLWQMCFLIGGAFQMAALFKESLIERGCSAFIAAFLFLWGFLNVLLYGTGWHFGLVAWGLFAAINLCALTRILAGVEKNNDPLRID